MRRGSGRAGVRRTKKRKTSETVILPQELINIILLRLPVKSLLQSKTVCKSWLFHISDPHFAVSHFQLAAARTERLLFIPPLARDFLSIDFNASLHDDSNTAALECEFLTPSYSYNVEILGSCRGFLLLCCRENLYLWNPCTGVRNSIDWSPIVSSRKIYFVFSYSLRGFGYDPVTDDYLVVLASYGRVSYQGNREFRVAYFSVRANKWKQFEASHADYMKCSRYNDNQIGCLFNSAIHWLAFRCDVPTNVIIAFDLTEKSLSEIPLPANFKYRNFERCVLRVLGELFSLCAVGHDSSVEIWVMDKYKVQSSWTKTIVVSVENIPTNLYFLPICSTKGGDIVGEDFGTGLVKCNDKGQLQEHRSYYDGQYGYSVAMYTESLLSLPHRHRERASQRSRRR